MRLSDRDRRVALKRLPERALQDPAGGFPGLRLEPNIHLEAIQGRTIRRNSLQVKPGASSFRLGRPFHFPSVAEQGGVRRRCRAQARYPWHEKLGVRHEAADVAVYDWPTTRT